MTLQDTSTRSMEQISWQTVLFSERLRHARLLSLRPNWSLESIRLAIHRNQPFELIGAVIAPFLAFAGLEADIRYSDYDDSLTFAGDVDADAHIVSLDFDRYVNPFDTSGLFTWLIDRMRALRTISDAPVLVTNWCSDGPRAADFNDQLAASLSGIPEVHVCDVASIVCNLGDDAFDDRSAEIKASRWSDQLSLQMARAFGLQWIPAITSPLLRAIAVDLDGTLYEGVLGEDGADGIRTTANHLALQKHLVDLRNRGVFLAVVSRNEREDVDRMFETRSDFLLQRADLSSYAVNWESKAENLAKIASDLRIGADAILFVDDNPGELATAISALPVRILHAADPEVALAGLKFYPGLFRFARTATDEIRADDLAASHGREEQLRQAADPAEYLRSLNIELTFARNDPTQLARTAELSNKTNQFNTALSRKTQTEITSRLEDGTLSAVTIGLRDKLSDSGIVGVVFAKSDDTSLRIEEICISCRALGRSLEGAMILQAVALLADEQTETVVFSYARGPRNDAALRWLSANVGEAADQRGDVTIAWDEARARETVMTTPAMVSIEGVR